MDYAGRRARLRERMADAGVDLVAVSPSANMHYLLGYHSHPDERPCYLLLTEQGEAMLMPELNASQAREFVSLPMETYTDAEGPVAALQRLAEQLAFTQARQLLVDETMRADFAVLLLEQLPQAELGVTTEILGGMRMQKDAEEIEVLRTNARQADQVMEAAFAAIEPGITEAQLADVVRAAFAGAGADGTNFAIIGAGPNGAYPHHATSKRAVQRDEPVLLDIGGNMNAYNSDLTRMAFVGTPDDEYLRIHSIVEDAVQAALDVVRPGVRARQVDEAARQVIADAGYGDYFTHRVGHGIGLTGHEPPYLTGTNDHVLDEGMTFSVEPGIYLPGQFGVRLEEIVTVTSSGVEVFSGLGRDVRRIS
jgi:Xaa-Pro aminopeptidase